MHLTALFSEAELAAQIDALMVKGTPDPSGRLTIYNYTKRAPYSPELWNHVTDKCRGLIVDAAGEVVARPFEKFWNLNDAHHPETLMENLPARAPVLTRKMDGSLGIGYPLDGVWRVATRGAFTSEQQRCGRRLGWRRGRLAFGRRGGRRCLRLCTPENQVVVRYQFAGLVLLALVKIETGEEASYAELVELGARQWDCRGGDV